MGIVSRKRDQMRLGGSKSESVLPFYNFSAWGFAIAGCLHDLLKHAQRQEYSKVFRRFKIISLFKQLTNALIPCGSMGYILVTTVIDPAVLRHQQLVVWTMGIRHA